MDMRNKINNKNVGDKFKRDILVSSNQLTNLENELYKLYSYNVSEFKGLKTSYNSYDDYDSYEEDYYNDCIKIKTKEIINYVNYKLYKDIKNENKYKYMEIGKYLIKNLNNKITEKDKEKINLIKCKIKTKLYPKTNNLNKNKNIKIFNYDIEEYKLNINGYEYKCESKIFTLYDKFGEENQEYFCINFETNNFIKLFINIEIFDKYKGKLIHEIPYELYFLFNEKKVNTYDKKFYIKEVINEKLEEEYNEKIDAILFNHQKNNLKWIESIETKVEDKLFNLEFINKKNYYDLEYNNNRYYYNKGLCDKPIFDEELLGETGELTKYRFRGGVLADEVGLGKTLTFITNILNNIEERTVIICPKRLVNQWYDEFNKYSKESLKKRMITIKTITDLKNKKREEIEKYNIIIISYDFLKSKTYIEWCVSKDFQEYLNMIYLNEINNSEIIYYNDEDYTIKTEIENNFYSKTGRTLNYQIIKSTNDENNEVKIPIITTKTYNSDCKYNAYNLIEDIEYDRIIIDEFHEIFDERINNYNNKTLALNSIIKKEIKYKWLISATPIINTELDDKYNSYNMILNYLSCGKYKVDNIIEKLGMEELKWIRDNIFRFNKKDKIEDIKIPNFEQENIFINQTETEKLIYNHIKNKDPDNLKRLMQICTHILVSGEEIDLLNFDMSSGKILSLNSINDIMTKDLITKKNKLEKMIKQNLIDIEILDKICNKIKEYFVLNNIVINNIENINTDEDSNIGISIEIDMTSNLNNFELEEIKKQYKRFKSKIYSRNNTIKTLEDRIKTYNEEISKFENNYIDEILKEPCGICADKIEDGILTKCKHIFCLECMNTLLNEYKQDSCPYCRTKMNPKDLKKLSINKVNDEDEEKSKEDNDNNKYGSKMNYLIKNINKILEEREDNKIILFSQWHSMLKLVGMVLNEYEIKYLECKGNVYMVSNTIRKFKNDNKVRVIMLSSENCVSGNNLTEASHIIMLDTMNADKKKAQAIEDQAIGRAVRIGQKRNVKIQRLITKDTIEYEYFIKNFPNEKPVNVI